MNNFADAHMVGAVREPPLRNTNEESQGLPEGWESPLFGEVIKPTRPRVKPAEYLNLPFIGMEHIEAHTMRLLGTVPASTMKSSSVHFYPGDVLYGRLRPYLNKVYRAEFEGLCSAEFIVFPKSESVDERYLQYFLNSWEFVSYASHLNEGDRPRVDFQQLAQYPFPLAPLPIQKLIVAEIEKQFSRLDEAVAALKRVQANLKRYKASVLKAAVEGRSTEEWREQNICRGGSRTAPTECESGADLLKRILVERQKKWEEDYVKKYVGAHGHAPKDDSWKKKYKEPAAPDTSSLPELPDGWVWARLDAIAQIKGGITIDMKRIVPNSRAVPYLRVANVQRGYLDLSEIKEIQASESDIKDLRLKRGDILFNEGGDRDKLGRGWIWENQLPECIHQNHVFRARLILSYMSPKLVSWWGNSFGKNYFLREGKQTTNLASINLTKLSSFPIPLPPLAEQKEIVEELDRRLSVAEEIEAVIETNLKRAERMRQAILKKAFEGRLV